MSAISQHPLEESNLAVFQLKGSLFTLTVLQLITADDNAFSAQLEAMLLQAPKFFHNAPIVIDLIKFTGPDADIDLAWYVDKLKKAGLVLVGLRSASPALQAEAVQLGLAILPEAKTESHAANKPASVSNAANAKSVESIPQDSKIITQQVRSGQQSYAKGGDLIVLAPVSPGAELLADGNIHVYAPLRGRALAGINGNTSARIFCQSLEAELVSIAGHYWIKDDLKSTKEQQALQIYLENEKLRFHYLGFADASVS